MRRPTHIAAYFLPLLTVSALVAMTYRPEQPEELPNRIPEPAPYDIGEAQFFPPPYEEAWESIHNPGRCGSCHARIFDEWNGSMMSNAWRDPAWRAAFLLIARITATDGDCDVPEPPDGTKRAHLNPFAVHGECASRFDTGQESFGTSRSGSLLDGFCSRCHMPTNYIDNIPLHQVEVDPETNLEHGQLRTTFDPTSDHGSGIAFAKTDALLRNTDTGKRGIFCSVCHTIAESRDTPFHNQAILGEEYSPALGTLPRAEQIADRERLESVEVPAADEPNLGYGIGAGAFRMSPHAIGTGNLFGPLAAETSAPQEDSYLSEVFGQPLSVEPGAYTEHKGFRHTKFARAEMCASCHDVTNPLTIVNHLGRWVGGFPIERTYNEWLGSEYADRPENKNFDPTRKRDCQTCHMQQHFGQPGTANTLYRDGKPLPPMRSQVAEDAPERTFFSHHFIGGNAYVPRLIGADVTESGTVESYPKLSVFSFSSKDKKSPYSRAYWTNTDSGASKATHHARLAWDRLRNVVDLDLTAPATTGPGERIPLVVRVANTGSGHKFPTGFPEGRVGWIAVRAFDLATGEELEIHDTFWERTSHGVGYLTDREQEDPSFPGCAWKLPAGSPDPYSYQIKAVATLGDGCPTLDLPYATPLNIAVDKRGLPVDVNGRVIDGDNPEALPVFRDLDGDGDLYDDAYLVDTRLRPLPHEGARVELDRYSVIVPPHIEGPIAVVAGLYYQSLEAIVSLKFLGNLADTDTDFLLEPCVLAAACDGREPVVEPPVVEGAPPVPMEIVQQVIQVTGKRDQRPPTVVSVRPADGSINVTPEVVLKITFSEPVTGIDGNRFAVYDEHGERVPASVDLVGDSTWALFPDSVFLEAGARYSARLEGGVCDAAGSCLERDTEWSFEIVRDSGSTVLQSTRLAVGFQGAGSIVDLPPTVLAVERTPGSEVAVTLSKPVMNVTPTTVRVYPAATTDCADLGEAMVGSLASDLEGARYTFTPAQPLRSDATYCVAISAAVYDLGGRGLDRPYRSVLR